MHMQWFDAQPSLHATASQPALLTTASRARLHPTLLATMLQLSLHIELQPSFHTCCITSQPSLPALQP